jgi:hypothetical protein
MANIDAPHGLVPLYKIGGGPIISNEYDKDASEGTAIFIGDVVTREADENIKAGGTPGTTLWLGVARNYGAASLATIHQVCDDPFTVFEAQDDGIGTAIVEADMGLNCNFIFGAGVVATGVSGHELDLSTKDVTVTLDAKMLRRRRVLNNAFGSANLIVEIQFNTHQVLPNVVGL